MSDLTLPDTIPYLSAKDICRYKYGNGKGQHCVLGWCAVLDGELGISQGPDTHDSFGGLVKLYILAELRETQPKGYNKPLTITSWNDFDATPEEVARTFNKAVKEIAAQHGIRYQRTKEDF